MGAAGFMAYRYKGQYYRMYLPEYARPSEFLPSCTRLIPRDPVKLEDWIANTTKSLEDKKQWPRLFPTSDDASILDDDDDSGEECDFDVEGDYGGKYVEVLSDSDPSWTLGAHFLWYTYVIDFDNRVFTVNGAVHFKLDNMPPSRGSRSERSLEGYLVAHERVKIPDKYLKTVDLWPPPHFDTTQAQQNYDGLHPLIVTLIEWGVSTWDALTVSQRLATSLAKTLIDDYTDELVLTQFPNVWHKIGFFCWQLANTVATSHLFCPPIEAPPQPNLLYVRADLIKRFDSIDPSIQHHLGGQGSIGRYYWFRGCLLTFCPRLDQPAYMMHQVGLMVENLRNHGRTSGVGIVMSGWHIIAVAVDGPEVRHSPVLDLHDGKELKDGVLLLMHLLSPTFTTSKTPWRNDPIIHQANAPSTLPEDILQQIIHGTDWDTYLILPLVSQYFRSICMTYPRVGPSILLGHETNANSELVFRVRTSSSASSTLTRLARIQSSIDNRLPLWKYCTKAYLECVLKPGLAGTFQHIQAGTGPLTNRADIPKGEGWFRRRLRFRDVIKGDKYPEMRIQAVDGLWVMLPINIEWDPNRRYRSWPYMGIIMARCMTGFDSEDLEELSEVEGGWYLK